VIWTRRVPLGKIGPGTFALPAASCPTSTPPEKAGDFAVTSPALAPEDLKPAE
jgi:hypothetical protein